MRLRVDPFFADSLAAHLAEQGFPVELVGDGMLEVLFPGSPWLLEAAAELDLWRARTGAAPEAWAALAAES